MNKKLLLWLHRGLLVLLLCVGPSLQADIVYPARLQLTETAPGLYDVFFVLPVIQGKILRAQAVFPEFCSQNSEPVTEVDSYQKKMRWQISCGENALAGQQIGIDGLLGSQVDIILEVLTLDGRIYKSTLSPAQAYYTIPRAPGFKDYFKTGTLPASRFVLMQWGLALLVLQCFLVLKKPGIAPLLVSLGLGLALGCFLTVREWLLVPSWAATTVSLGIAAIISISTLIKGQPKKVWAVYLLTGICAILAGAGFIKEGTPGGYTSGESGMLLGFAFLGFFMGALILIGIGRQISRLLDLGPERLRSVISRILSGLFLGVFLWKLSLFWYVPSTLPAIPGLLLMYTLILVMWSLYSALKTFIWWSVWFGVIFGFALGFSGYTIPYSWAIVLSFQSTLILLILFRRQLSTPWISGILLLSSLALGNYLQAVTSDFLSYPLARSVFFILLLTALALALKLVLKRPEIPGLSSKALRIWSALFLVVSLISGLQFLTTLYVGEIQPVLFNGFLPIPVVSVILLISAMVFWPRKRKIHKEINVPRKLPLFSVLALVLAFFWLPIHLSIRNPWYSTENMDSSVVHGLMEQKLLNTYTAFNLSEEEELFERLTENLDEKLLDHVYLDSRRRLTMGLREGSTVTVKEVLLGELGNVLDANTAEAGLRYPASWTVTAQVKHLKHIHYRKNKYTGIIGLKSVDNAWKISEIILTSEDREVIASSAL